MAFLNQKRIAQFMLFALCFVQFALAQHAMVHFSPESHIDSVRIVSTEYKISHDTDSSHSEKSCQVCFLAHNLNQGIGTNPALIAEPVFNHITIPSVVQNQQVRTITYAFQARAPPSLLI